MNNLPEGFTPTNRRMMEESKPKIVKRYNAYRPLGFLIVISLIVFIELLDHGTSPMMAVLTTMLISFLMLRFS